MKLNDAMDKTRAAARPEWKDKAVCAFGGMLLICSFHKDVPAEWSDKLGHHITDAINAEDYEPVDVDLNKLVRYRTVGYVVPEVSEAESEHRKNMLDQMRELGRRIKATQDAHISPG